jgi:signal-transduction protein with cAMP-binding, CBS, and nucleotidyltransferase domain
MLCPVCYEPNLPGVDACERCGWDMSAIDRPVAYDRVERSLMQDNVRSLGCPLPALVSPETHLSVVVEIMMQSRVGAVLVVNEDARLIGILTERDFLTKVAGLAGYAEHAVRDYMTPDPEAVTPDDPIAFALGKMSLGNYRHIPVIESGHPVGLLSVGDVLKHIVNICHE